VTTPDQPALPPATARDDLRRLGVLIAINFVDMVGFAIILPLLPFYAMRLDGSPLMVGVITSVFSVAQLLSAPLWGRVSDRYGRRPALLAGLLASAAAYAVFGLADSLALLLLSRFVQGAGGGTTGVTQAYIADTVQPARRARALGWLSAATSAGVMVGPVVGSAGTHLGASAPGFIAATLCLINAVCAWWWLPESRVPGQGASRPRPPIMEALVRVVRHPAELSSRLIWIYGAGMLAFSGLTSVLALFLAAEYGVTQGTIGWFFFYVGLLSVVMRSLLLGPIVAHVGEVRAMRIGALTLVIGLLLFPATGSIVQLALVIPLVPIGTALLFPSSTSLLTAATDREQTGLMMGVAQTFAGASRIIAPLGATFAFQQLGHASPFLLAAAVVGAVSLLAWRVDPQPGRPSR
jgi:MFS family permease